MKPDWECLWDPPRYELTQRAWHGSLEIISNRYNPTWNHFNLLNYNCRISIELAVWMYLLREGRCGWVVSEKGSEKGQKLIFGCFPLRFRTSSKAILFIQNSYSQRLQSWQQLKEYKWQAENQPNNNDEAGIWSVYCDLDKTKTNLKMEGLSWILCLTKWMYSLWHIYVERCGTIHTTWDLTKGMNPMITQSVLIHFYNCIQWIKMRIGFTSNYHVNILGYLHEQVDSFGYNLDQNSEEWFDGIFVPYWN